MTSVYGKAGAVAGHPAYSHHHIACRRSRRHRHRDARGSPTRGSRCGPVERHRARPLARAKVRSSDRHRRPYRANCRAKARNRRPS